MAREMLTPHEAIRRAQSAVRAYIPEGSNLADELITDRRREATAPDDGRRLGEPLGGTTRATR